jgi:hypothetical protein
MENLQVQAGLTEEGFLWAIVWEKRRKKGLDHTTH